MTNSLQTETGQGWRTVGEIPRSHRVGQRAEHWTTYLDAPPPDGVVWHTGLKCHGSMGHVYGSHDCVDSEFNSSSTSDNAISTISYYFLYLPIPFFSFASLCQYCFCFNGGSNLKGTCLD